MKKNGKKKQNNKQIDLALAKRYGTVPATIARWRREKAPLGDEIAMRSWLASRKNLPPGTKRLLAHERNAERASFALEDQTPASPMELGAEAALRRLEREELSRSRALKRAHESGDHLQIKIALDAWLKVSETLRRCNLALDESLRGAGELVERKQVELILGMTGLAVRVALKGSLESVVPKLIGLSDPHQIWSVLKECVDSAVDGVANFTVGTVSEQPAWARESLSSGFDFLGKVWAPERLAAVARICAFFSALSGAGPYERKQRIQRFLTALISQPLESFA